MRGSQSRSLRAPIAQPQASSNGADTALLYIRRHVGPQAGPRKKSTFASQTWRPQLGSHIHTSISIEILPLKTTFIPLDFSIQHTSAYCVGVRCCSDGQEGILVFPEPLLNAPRKGQFKTTLVGISPLDASLP